MFVVINNWRKKLLHFLVILVLILVFAAAVPRLAGIFYEQIPALGGWLKDEHPRGNPLRVDNEEQSEQNNSKFNQVLDQVVIKLHNFYYKE